MHFVAVATDYDGTIAHDGIVDDQTLDALARLRKTGRRLILATGRELPDLRRVLPDLKLFDRVVAENGAVLYLPATEEERVIAPEPPPAFVERLRAERIEPLSVGRSIVATWEPNETAVLEAIRDLGLELQIIFNKGAVMVQPAGVNKAFGLAAALEDLGISPLNVVGFGDAENDHAFLRACGCAVAVANALAMVKEDADVLTEGARGAGVREVIERLLAGEEGELLRAAKRHLVVFGADLDGRDVALEPSRGGVLITGPSGSGKSTLATAILERVIERNFQVCLLDPEGDYSEFEPAVVLGDAKAVPRVQEVKDLLKEPRTNVVVNMLALDIAERPSLFAKLLAELSNMRAGIGRPHWILVDEAHHMLPSARGAVSMTLPQELPAAIFVTVHPDSMSPDALALVDTVLAIGETANDVVEAVCRVVSETCPELPARPPREGEAVYWRRSTGEACLVTVEKPRQARRRHTRKYAEGSLGEDKSFYFSGPNGALKLRAQNLTIFLQIGDGVDDETWLHHLRSGDFSEWFRNAIKDEELAREVEQCEKDEGLDAARSRACVREAVERRYTAPASADE